MIEGTKGRKYEGMKERRIIETKERRNEKFSKVDRVNRVGFIGSGLLGRVKGPTSTSSPSIDSLNPATHWSGSYKN